MQNVVVELYVYDHQNKWYEWIAWKDLKRLHEIVKVRFADEGSGFDHVELTLFRSSKTGADVGGFGEGIKLLSTGALRKGIHVKFRSREWVAGPFLGDRGAGDEKARVLCYRVLKNLAFKKGAITTLGQLDKETQQHIRRLDDYVLSQRTDFLPQHSCTSGDLFEESASRSLPNGSVFNKGFYITDSYQGRLLFSYDLRLPVDSLAADRNMVDFDEMRKAIKEIVSSCASKKPIKRILRSAEKNRHRGYIEFEDLSLSPDAAIMWKEAFHEEFGERSVLYTRPFTHAMAVHDGYKVVHLNENVMKVLHRAGVEYDKEVVAEGFVPDIVPYESLSQDERDMIERLKRAAEVLSLAFGQVRIYKTVTSRYGKDLTPHVGGYWDGTFINMRRDRLEDFASALRTYLHELGHMITRAHDPEDAFRDYFEYYMTAFVSDEVARRESNSALRVDVEAFRAMDHKRMKALQDEVRQKDTEIRRLKRSNRRLAAANALQKAIFHAVESSRSLLRRKKKKTESSFAGDTALSVTFACTCIRNEAMVAVTATGLNENDAFDTLSEALLRMRRGLERFSGLFGKQTEHEKSVRVSTKIRGSETWEELSAWRKTTLLRKIARDRGTTNRNASTALARLAADRDLHNT